MFIVRLDVLKLQLDNLKKQLSVKFVHIFPEMCPSAIDELGFVVVVWVCLGFVCVCC